MQVSVSNLSLVPFPAQIEIFPGKFLLEAKFRVYLSQPDVHDRLLRGITRVLRRLDDRTCLFLETHVVSPLPHVNVPTGALIVCASRKGDVNLHENESYSLTVTPEKIELNAETDIGCLRGLETFLQILNSDDNNFYFPCINIIDKPYYKWRGILLDVCRHWIPIEVIKRNIDGLAAVKMNVLHMHLTEDQGFRIESLRFPKLHLHGSSGNYFTQIQIREIISYANDRGMRVVPEFDMPGHMTSWLVGHPELTSDPSNPPQGVERSFGVHDHTLNPTLEETYQFLDEFFQEMCGLFPDEYMHIGGDENNGKQWDTNKEIIKFKQQHGFNTNMELQLYFNRRILQILNKYGKKMIGWDEIFEENLPKDIVIQSWRGTEALTQAAKKGYPTILSNGWYIDLLEKTEKHYLNFPIPKNSDLSATEKSNILGGEATMWSELVTQETIDSRIWPRTAAIAERLWSSPEISDVENMFFRLQAISIQLEEHGLTHIKNKEMLMRRMIGSTHVEALRVLADAVEPLKGYKRHSSRKYYTHSPYTSIADIACVDSRTSIDLYKYATDVNHHLLSVKHLFTLWKDNHTKLVESVKSPTVKNSLCRLSLHLSRLASVGLLVIAHLENKSIPNGEERENYKGVMTEVKETILGVELSGVGLVEKLIALL